jgi:hypothetical protein
MDENKGTRPGATDPREELREQVQLMGKAAGDLLEQLVRLPATLAQIPLQALPEDTATHARNAATEGMKAVRALVEGISRGVDEMMRAQGERMDAMKNQAPSAGDYTPNSDVASAAGAPPAAEGAKHDHEGTPTSLLGDASMGSGMPGSSDSDLNGGPKHTVRLDDETQ